MKTLLKITATLFCFGLGFTEPSALLAQPVIAPPASVVSPPSAAAGASDSHVGSSASLASGLKQSRPLLLVAGISVRPHLLYRVMEADGLLNATQTEDSTSVIQTVALGLTVKSQKMLTFDYTISKNFYSNPIFKDELAHEAVLTGNLSHRAWTLGLSQSYSSNASTLVETGQQTPQEKYTTTVDVVYKLGERTRIVSGAALHIRNVNSKSKTPDWTMADWRSLSLTELLYYSFTDRLTLGIGYIIGYDDPTPGVDMATTQPRVELSWLPTNKLSLGATYGVEKRKLKPSNIEDLNNPVYTASLGYAPLPTTKLSLKANRSYSASYFSNSIVNSKGWGGGIDQRLIGKLYVGASANWNKIHYIATGLTTIGDRHDTERSLGLHLSTPFVGQGLMTVSYDHGNNRSTIPGYTFSSHQVAFEVSYRF